MNGWGRKLRRGVFGPGLLGLTELPDPPDELGPFSDVIVSGPEHAVNGGWVLHVPTGTWTELEFPPVGRLSGVASAWAGDRLAVWGGAEWPAAQGRLTARGWLWLPS